MKDEESKVREDAALALGKIGVTGAVGPLIEALKDEDHWYIHLSALDLWKKKHPNWRAIRVPIHEMPACSSARANFRYPKAGYQIFATFPRLGGKMPIDMVFPLNENKPRLSSDGVLEGTYYYFFRVRYAAAESLRNVTGQDYGEDYKKWQKWYLGKEND